jgi:hypothetical protein
MFNQLFTEVSLEQQEIVAGGGIEVYEDNYSEFLKDTLKQAAWTSANEDGAETTHYLELSDVEAFANVFKEIYF